MNRRTFLKYAFFTTAALTLPSIPITANQSSMITVQSMTGVGYAKNADLLFGCWMKSKNGWEWFEKKVRSDSDGDIKITLPVCPISKVTELCNMTLVYH